MSRPVLLIAGGSRGIGAATAKLAGTRGYDVAVNYKTEDFVAMTKEATGGKGANLIVDIVGGDYVDRNYDCAAEQGTIAQVSFTGGPKATAHFARMMQKRLIHTGSTLRPRTIGASRVTRSPGRRAFRRSTIS